MMSDSRFISTNFAAVLVYGRLPLVFGGMLFAVAVMLNQSLTAYGGSTVFGATDTVRAKRRKTLAVI